MVSYQKVIDEIKDMSTPEFINMFNKVCDESHIPEHKIHTPYYWNCHGCAYWNGDNICRSCVNNPFSMSGTRENKWTWNEISQDCKNQEHHIKVPMEYEEGEFQ